MNRSLSYNMSLSSMPGCKSLFDFNEEEFLLFATKSKMQYESINSENIQHNSVLAYAYTVIFHEAIELLKISGSVNPMSAVTCSTKIFSLEEKCTKSIFELYNLPPTLLASSNNSQSYFKFQRDRCYVEKMFTMLHKEFVRKRNFNRFADLLEKEISQDGEEKDFLENSANGKKIKEDLRKTLSRDGHDYNLTLQEQAERIGRRGDYVENMFFENRLKEKYVDKWENSRLAQNRRIFEENQNKVARRIKECRFKIKQEYRVHREIEKYTNMVIEDNKKLLQEWQDKYEQELDEKDLKIAHIRLDKEMQLFQLEKDRLQYNQREAEIVAYREHKVQLKIQAEILQKQTVAAIKVQAWWRGVMVRNSLGPYRKKKRRGAKGKKGSAKGPKSPKNPKKKK